MSTDAFRAAVDRAMLANDALNSALWDELEALDWPALLMKMDALYLVAATTSRAKDWVSLAGMCLEAARMSTPAGVAAVEVVS